MDNNNSLRIGWKLFLLPSSLAFVLLWQEFLLCNRCTGITQIPDLWLRQHISNILISSKKLFYLLYILCNQWWGTFGSTQKSSSLWLFKLSKDVDFSHPLKPIDFTEVKSDMCSMYNRYRIKSDILLAHELNFPEQSQGLPAHTPL